MEENIYYVYVYYDGEIPIYVGKGKNSRYKEHLKRCFKQKKGTSLFYDKIRKMINSGNPPGIKIISENMSETEALKLERIKEIEFGTILNQTGTLLNISPCGNKNPILFGKENPMFGKSIFDVWKENYTQEEFESRFNTYTNNLSNSLIGKKHTEETKEKQSKKRKEYFENLTEEKKSLRSDNISRSFTDERKEELRQKMVERNKKSTGKNSPKARKCTVEGIVYDSIKDVQEKYGMKNHNSVRHRINSNNFKDWNWYE
jgi:hypothetical protein